MKKMRTISLFLIFILLTCSITVSVDAVDPSVLAQSSISLDAGKHLAGDVDLSLSSKSAVLYCFDSDAMIYSLNPDEQLDPSGMNKIMTALLAIEKGDLDANVTVTQSALSSVEFGAMSASLKVGEVLTLRQLLYCMMVGSANDAAAVIAEHISGGQAGFIQEMNKRAAEIGCTNTKFLNPTGLSVEGQYSSARDLAKITAEALKHEEFSKFFSAAEYTIAANDYSPERKIVTTNYMIGDSVRRDYLDSRITGGKTGALSTADRSLISTAEHDGLKYLIVVMSAKSIVSGNGSAIVQFTNFTETKELLDHAVGNYSMRQLLGTDEVMEQFQVAGGDNDLTASAAETVISLMPNDMARDQLLYRCLPGDGLSAPVEKGDVIGSVQLWYGSTCVAESDLTAMYQVKQIGQDNIPLKPEARLEHNGWKIVLIVLLVIVICVTILAAGRLLWKRLLHGNQANRRRRNGRRRR